MTTTAKKKLTPAQAMAQQRASLRRKITRLRARYDRPEVTDDQIKAVLEEMAVFLAAAPARYNARPGGMGR